MYNPTGLCRTIIKGLHILFDDALSQYSPLVRIPRKTKKF